MNEPETIKRILDECRTIAVIGLSSDPSRASHGVAAFMQRSGCKVIPVNPNETEVLGEKAYGHLSEVPVDVLTTLLFHELQIGVTTYLALVGAATLAFILTVLVLRRTQRLNLTVVLPVLIESAAWAVTA